MDDAGDDRAAHRQGRAALLRLARWFDGADTETAAALHAAAFADRPARFLGGAPDDTAPAAASWWNSPPAPVGPAAGTGGQPAAPQPVPDHAPQRGRLRAAAEARAHWRRTAAGEVLTALADGAGTPGEAETVELSRPALEVLMELLTAALGSGAPTERPASAGDLELGVLLEAAPAPGAQLTLSSPDGALELSDLRLRAADHAIEERTP